MKQQSSQICLRGGPCGCRCTKLLLEQRHLKYFTAWSPIQLSMLLLLTVTECSTALATLFQVLNQLRSLCTFYLHHNTDNNRQEVYHEITNVLVLNQIQYV